MMAETIPFPGAHDKQVTAEQIPVTASEDEYADAFSERHADSLRYVALWSRWLQWDGSCWKFETTLAAFDLARQVAREFAKLANGDPEIAKASVVAAIERLARADRRHASTTDQWDADQMLFQPEEREDLNDD
jgi:putative DNA primase/helicase